VSAKAKERGLSSPRPQSTSELENPPSSWAAVKLGEICDRVQDATLPSQDGYRLYLGLEHLASGYPNLVGRGIESDVKSGKTAFRSNDVLFGKLRPYLRKSVRVDESGVCSTDILVFRSKGTTDADFLCLLTHTDEFVEHAKATTSGVQHPRTSWSSLKEFILRFPPLAEQRKIAGVLGLVQRAMEQQERLIALTTELKKALLHQLFTQGLHCEPQKQTEIGPVPQSWHVTRFDEFCILQRGFDIIKKDQVAGDVPVVSSGGIASYHNAAKVKGPGVIVGRKGTLGKVHYIEGDYWPHDTTLWVKDFKAHNPLFTSYFLATLRFERFNSGASNPTLNRNTVHAEIVAYPEVDEQGEIGRILKAVDDKAHMHERKHAALTALFRTLLHQLMTAQIRAHDVVLTEH
jgi:type I restriction enzyme, S subunit